MDLAEQYRRKGYAHGQAPPSKARRSDSPGYRLPPHGVQPIYGRRYRTDAPSSLASQLYWPSQTWRASTPEEQGIDSAQLVKMMDSIQARRLDIHSILIVRHGYLVTEAYFQPFQANSVHFIASCVKSVASALTGITIEQGYIDSVNHKMLDYFPDRTIANMDARKRAITLEQMLTMSAGLAWDEWRPNDAQNSYFQMVQIRDWTQFALDQPTAQEPGTQFNYNSALPDLMASIIEKTSKTSIRDFLKKYLLEPLGITDYVVGANSGMPTVALMPRDIAKLGFLYLNNGVWNAKQVVPAAWVKASTDNHIQTPYGENYGYFWWLPLFGGYAAEGDAGQRIFVLPDQDMVVVLTAGLTYPDMMTVPNDLMQTFVLPAIKSPNALPPNPQAVSRLNDLLQAIQQPQPGPVPALPATAQSISGKTYILKPNSIGLGSFALDFSGQAATIKLSFGGQSAQMGIGLDNTYRITPIKPVGPLSGWMALRGMWLGAGTFSIHLMMSGVVRDLDFQFMGDNVTVWFRGSRGEREMIPGTLQK